MFGIEWSELLLIGVVALIAIGPKDLPKALKAVGFYVRKAREMSREFQGSIDQMIRESELDEARKELSKVTNLNIAHEFEKTIDPTGDLAKSLQPPEMPSLTDSPAAPSTTPAAPTTPGESAALSTAATEATMSHPDPIGAEAAAAGVTGAAAIEKADIKSLSEAASAPSLPSAPIVPSETTPAKISGTA